ncbi:MAG: tetratricopeptide repeat-containing glycosyltransferase family 2 protein [Candidatus Scalindua sp.]
MNNTISLCMIVKDEEEFLPRCLDSVKDYVDEMIIVDTGSTDRTVEIAKSFGAKVYHHTWENSFSKARNYSLKYATCDWILYLDADEELSKEDAPRLKELVKNNNYTTISLVIKNKFEDSTQESYANMIRLFKNFNGIYYEGIVHNTIKYSGKCLESSLSIIHHGYNLSGNKMEEKFLRTATLLKEQIKADPHNPIPHRYLGISYMGVKMYDEAIEESKTALRLAEERGCLTGDLFVSYYIISAAFFEKGALKESETYAMKKVEMDDQSLDGYCILSFIYYNLKKYDKFLKNSEKYLTLWDSITKHPERTNASISHTIGHKWKIHLLRGFYYLLNGQDETGNKEIDSAINESTEIEKCHNLLGNFYLENNYLDKAEEAFKKLLDINEHTIDAMVKIGHIKFRKGDLKETIHFWKKAVDAEPTLFDIRLLVCKINIVQGNLEEVVTECDQLLQILDISRNIVLESMTDIANLFNLIGERLKDKQELQAAETSFKISKDLKQIHISEFGLRIAEKTI